MIDYEWDVEIMDGEDIADHHFCCSYTEAVEVSLQHKHAPVVLVRSDYSRGGDDRMWAYFTRGVTRGFQDSAGVVRMNVPKRYLKEVERA